MEGRNQNIKDRNVSKQQGAMTGGPSMQAYLWSLYVIKEHHMPCACVYYYVLFFLGPSTRMLHSLVSVVKKCSKLTNHSMRLNAFFLGLLKWVLLQNIYLTFSTNEINSSVVIIVLFHSLSALESWFWHLHTCVGKSLMLFLQLIAGCPKDTDLQII